MLEQVPTVNVVQSRVLIIAACCRSVGYTKTERQTRREARDAKPGISTRDSSAASANTTHGGLLCSHQLITIYDAASAAVLGSNPHRRHRPHLPAGQLVCCPAQAAASTGTCASSALSQPFLKSGRLQLLSAAGQRRFRGLAVRWTLSHGAQKAAGSEPYGATGKVGTWSLALAAGASAQSPFTCVTASKPSFRFFARNEGPAATVLVEVIYKTPFGNASRPRGHRHLEKRLAAYVEHAHECRRGRRAVQQRHRTDGARFTAATGASKIDDIYIDPRAGMRGQAGSMTQTVGGSLHKSKVSRGCRGAPPGRRAGARRNDTSALNCRSSSASAMLVKAASKRIARSESRFLADRRAVAAAGIMGRGSHRRSSASSVIDLAWVGTVSADVEKFRRRRR